MTNSVTTAPAEISNGQLRKEIDLLNAENLKLKDQIGQLNALVNQMAIANESQMQQIDAQKIQITRLLTENQQLKVNHVT